jgi:hypothetical protein
MSLVTDVLLTCELVDDECYGYAVRRFELGCGVARFVRVDGAAVGHKGCQAVIGLAAVNYLDERALVLAVRSQPWTFPDAVKIFVHRESSDGGFVELTWR